MSKKSSKVILPSPSSEKTSAIRWRNGLSWETEQKSERRSFLLAFISVQIRYNSSMIVFVVTPFWQSNTPFSALLFLSNLSELDTAAAAFNHCSISGDFQGITRSFQKDLTLVAKIYLYFILPAISTE